MRADNSIARAAARRLGSLAAACLLGGMVAAPARADNPRISIKVTDATAEEAVAQLSKASGLKVALNGFNPAAQPGGQPQKYSFDWTNVTFGKALRQLCDKFNARPYRQGAVYNLQPQFQAPVINPPKRVGLVEKNGVKMYARRAYIYDNRSINFIGEDFGGGGGYLNLELGAELGDGDAELIAGIQNVTARDDQGGVITSDPQRFGSSSYNPYGMFPDEWTGSTMINPPSAKAKKLEWLEGDLMVYKSIKPLKLEIPLPLPSKAIRKDLGDMIVVVSNYEDVNPAAPDQGKEEDLDLPKVGPNIGVQPQQKGFKIRVRVYTPQGANRQQRYFSRSGWNFAPTVETGTGGMVNPNMSNSSGWGNGEWSVSDMNLTYQIPPQAGAKPEAGNGSLKLVWDLVERGEMVKLMTFRMTDIPLPQVGQVPPRKTPPLPAPNPNGPADRGPFYEKGGGILVSKIEVAGKPVTDGMLQVGLSFKEGAEFGPVRWTDVVVGPDGTARLEDLKPGAYRVLRRYRPKEPLANAEQGKWLNGEATATLITGKELPLAPLRWSLGGDPVKPVTAGGNGRPAINKRPAGGPAGR